MVMKSITMQFKKNTSLLKKYSTFRTRPEEVAEIYFSHDGYRDKTPADLRQETSSHDFM
jgi:hypothetical protein